MGINHNLVAFEEENRITHLDDPVRRYQHSTVKDSHNDIQAKIINQQVNIYNKKFERLALAFSGQNSKSKIESHIKLIKDLIFSNTGSTGPLHSYKENLEQLICASANYQISINALDVIHNNILHNSDLIKNLRLIACKNLISELVCFIKNTLTHPLQHNAKIIDNYYDSIEREYLLNTHKATDIVQNNTEIIISIHRNSHKLICDFTLETRAKIDIYHSLCLGLIDTLECICKNINISIMPNSLKRGLILEIFRQIWCTFISYKNTSRIIDMSILSTSLLIGIYGYLSHEIFAIQASASMLGIDILITLIRACHSIIRRNKYIKKISKLKNITLAVLNHKINLMASVEIMIRSIKGTNQENDLISLLDYADEKISGSKIKDKSPIGCYIGIIAGIIGTTESKLESN